MSRVSENSHQASMNFAIERAKTRLENLQMQGASLKKVNKPSDDPIGNMDLLIIRSKTTDNSQYKKSANFARTQLEYTETALADLQEIMLKAKDIAVTQASDLYNPDVKKNVAKEVEQLFNQSVTVGNRRLGNRYIFGGHSILNPPFDSKGNYHGDKGHTSLEVSKDIFVNVNLNGAEVFHLSKANNAQISSDPNIDPKMIPTNLDGTKQPINTKESKDNPNSVEVGRQLASVDESAEKSSVSKDPSLFNILQNLQSALETNDTGVIQGILPKLDDAMNQILSFRTKIGALMNTVNNSEITIDQESVSDAARKSKIEDADVAELFSDLNTQQNVLKSAYKSGATILNQNLLQFLK